MNVRDNASDVADSLSIDSGNDSDDLSVHYNYGHAGPLVIEIQRWNTVYGCYRLQHPKAQFDNGGNINLDGCTTEFNIAFPRITMVYLLAR